MNKRFLLAIFCLCASLLYAHEWTLETVPSPKDRGQDYYVTNPDSVILAETEQQINDICVRLEKKTMVEMAVVVLNEFDEYHYDTYSFALRLFNYWGVGKSDKNTGVLVFLSKASRDIQIITGSGIEGVLTDAECGVLLDNNLYYFSEDDFDQGMRSLCNDIAEYLMEDNNCAELLLGWHPKGFEQSYLLMGYFIAGFLLLVLFGWLAYKRLNGQPGETKKELTRKSDDLVGCSGCLLFFFPIPLLFFYLYLRYARKHLKDVPLPCSKCGHDMQLEPEDTMIPQLNSIQQLEQKLSAYEYRLWKCPDCGATEIKSVHGCFFTRYDDCPNCKGHTMALKSHTNLIKATYEHGGEKVNHYVCESCGHKLDKKVQTKRLVESTSYSSSSSSSSSWGGGGSSSGSWGGGRSSGGGAGRHF